MNNRNDRAITHQEVDLLAKLDPRSKAAQDLNEVIQARIGRWHAKAYKTEVDKGSGASHEIPRRSESRIAILWKIALYLVMLVTVAGLLGGMVTDLLNNLAR